MTLSDQIEEKIKEICGGKSTSGTTIYDRAIQVIANDNSQELAVIRQEQRVSTSSEDVDTSGEMVEINGHINNLNLIADEKKRQREKRYDDNRFYDERLTAGPSMDHEQTAKERSDRLLREAEASKACILDPPGNDFMHVIDTQSGRDWDNLHGDYYEHYNFYDEKDGQKRTNEPFQCRTECKHHPSIVDDDFLIIGNFVEEHVK